MPNVGYAAAEMPGIITSVGLHRGAPIQIPITDPVETSKSVMPQPPKDGAGAEEAKRLDAAYREALLLGTAQYRLDTVLRTAAQLQPAPHTGKALVRRAERTTNVARRRRWPGARSRATGVARHPARRVRSAPA